jgi:hypothetical protein
VGVDLEELFGKELTWTPDAKTMVRDTLAQLPLPAGEIKHALFSLMRQGGETPTSKDAASVGVKKKRKP